MVRANLGGTLVLLETIYRGDSISMEVAEGGMEDRRGTAAGGGVVGLRC